MAQLGPVGRFFRSRQGKTVLFVLWAVFMIGLIWQMAYDMEHCPRMSEGLC